MKTTQKPTIDTSVNQDKTERSDYLIGFMLAIIGAMLFSIRPILVKFAYQDGIDSVSLLTLRMLFSLPFYAVLFLYFLRDVERRKTLNPKLITFTALIGLCGYYAASLLDLIGLQYISAQLERLLLFTYPTLVVIFGALFFRKKITSSVVIALAFSYAGIASIFSHDFQLYGSNIIKGSIFVGLSTVVFSLYVLFGKQIINKIGSRMFTCIAMIAASTGIFIHFLITNDVSDLMTTNKVYLLCLAIAVFCTIIPSFCISEAIARIGPDRTSITGTIGPVFTAFFAVSLLGEVFSVYHALGMVLVIIGVAILGYNKPVKRPIS